MSQTFELSTGKREHRVHALVTLSGNDIAIIIGGGSQPHIGAVSMAISSPSMKDPAHNTSTASVISVPGHKEFLIVQDAAIQLSRSFNTTVIISAGMHIENANQNDINLLVENFNNLIGKIEHELENYF